MIKILICDDEPVFLKYIESRVKDIIAKGIFGEKEFLIVSHQDPQKALEYCEENLPQIVFLDIDMPDVSGFDIAQYLKDAGNVKTIFVSSYDTFVYTSLKFRPFRFIRKNMLENELKEAIDAALSELVTDKQIFMMKDASIACSEIFYIESNKNYVRIVTADCEYKHRITIKEVEEMLRSVGFVRCHTAYVVNMQKIKSAFSDNVVLEGGKRLSVSAKYKKTFFDAYLKFMRA